MTDRKYENRWPPAPPLKSSQADTLSGLVSTEHWLPTEKKKLWANIKANHPAQAESILAAAKDPNIKALKAAFGATMLLDADLIPDELKYRKEEKL